MEQENRGTTKLHNAILFILRRSTLRPGVTSLLKMLFFADLRHYRCHLSSVTGARYVALERGPVIDNYRAILADMVELRFIEERTVPVLGVDRPKTEYAPLYEPDMSVFTPSEIEALESVVRDLGAASGSLLSQQSHLEGPWQLAWNPHEPGRPIPYELFRWLDNLPDELDIERANARIKERGLTDLITSLPRTRV